MNNEQWIVAAHGAGFARNYSLFIINYSLSLRLDSESLVELINASAGID
jgi:hypothetical protein